jgi:hypothetical protein
VASHVDTRRVSALLLPAVAAWKESRGLFARCVTNTSKWSYSLYLVHIPVILLVTALLRSGGGCVVRVSGKLLSLSLCISLGRGMKWLGSSQLAKRLMKSYEDRYLLEYLLAFYRWRRKHVTNTCTCASSGRIEGDSHDYDAAGWAC